MGSQILTPGGMRAQSSRVIVAGAGVNFLLNLVLIPRFLASGAAAASVIAECFITIFYLWLGRGFVKPSMIWKYGWRRLLAGLAMLGAVLGLGNALETAAGTGPAVTFAQIIGGAVVYG